MNIISNIVIVCEFAQFSGGSQNIAINSAIELAKRGFNVIFFTALGDECNELKASNVRVKHLHLKNITEDSNRVAAAIRGLWNRDAANELEKVLLEFPIESTIVHVHNWSNAFSSSVIRRATKLGYKTVITLHDYLTVCPNGGFYDYKHNHICLIEPMSLKCIACNCDRRSYPQKLYRVVRELIQNCNVRYNANLNFITISQLNDDLIRSRVKSKKIFRVDNFVQTKCVNRKERKDSYSFICVGRIVKEKGVEIFCKAVTSLKEKHPEVCGKVLGDGPLLSQLKKDYPAVEFSGWVSHDAVDCAMENARCLVFPSVLYECSPLTVIEAFSSGLPCIASDCTTAKELILDGINGFLFKAGDSESLAEKMENALLNDAYVAIEKKINDTFDPSKYTCAAYTDNILRVYNKIGAE
jgi:glycosyltransferase involved in cell wall biosynthesis